MDYQILIDSKCFNKKPTSDETKIITTNIVKNVVTLHNMQDFADIIELGHTFTPAVFSNKKDTEHWQSQQVIALDFDSKDGWNKNRTKFNEGDILVINKWETIEFLTNWFGCKPNIIYDTFSNTCDYPRFRVIYILNETITDLQVASNLYKLIIDVVPNVDNKITPINLFYAGTNVQVLNTEMFSLFSTEDQIGFYDALCTKEITRTHKYNARRIKLPKKSVFSTPTYITKAPTQNTLFLTSSEVTEQYFKDQIGISPENLRRDDFKTTYQSKMYTEVRQFRDFCNGVQLKHAQIFAMATNLQYFRNGTTFMIDTMVLHNSTGDTDYTPNEFEAVYWASYKDYLPMNIKTISQYEEDHQNRNLIQAVVMPHGKVILHTPLAPKIKLLDAELQMQTFFSDALKQDDNNIYILKCETGLGKSKMLNNIRASNALIAFHTHDLKEEMQYRLKEFRETDLVKVTPELPLFEDKSLQNQIDNKLRISDTTAIRIWLEHIEAMNVSNEDEVLAKKFIKNLKECYESKEELLTTHARALLTEFKHDTIIFDEDPFSTMFSTNYIKESDIMQILKNIKDKPELAIIYNALESILNSSSKKFKLPRQPEISYKALKQLVSEKAFIQVQKLLSSTHIFKDYEYKQKQHIISWTNRLDLPNKKCIIMSATVNIEIYQKLYGDRVKSIDLTNIETIGTLNQYYSKSFSQSSLNNCKDFSNINQQLKTITFKKLKHLFTNSDLQCHFNNCSGYDHLKGMSINVVGTPHKPEWVYKLLCFALDIDFDEEDTIKSRIYRNTNYQYRFATFENKELAEMQQWLIKSDIKQAIGRARILRELCNVNLYANIPI